MPTIEEEITILKKQVELFQKDAEEKHIRLIQQMKLAAKRDEEIVRYQYVVSLLKNMNQWPIIAYDAAGSYCAHCYAASLEGWKNELEPHIEHAPDCLGVALAEALDYWE